MSYRSVPLSPSDPQTPGGYPQVPPPSAWLGVVAGVLIALVSLGGVALAAASWLVHQVFRDLDAGAAGVGESEFRAAALLEFWLAVACLTGFAAAAVVFVVWLWQARRKAEALRPWVDQSRARGWLIGGWICPIVNLWFPYQIVRDISTASDPATPDTRVDLGRRPASLLVAAWWALFLAGSFADRYVGRMSSDEVTTENLRRAAVGETASAGIWIGAGVLAILIIRRITAWQSGRTDAVRDGAPVNPPLETPYVPGA